MNLPKLAIENHQFTTVLIILLVLFGLVSFVTMPRSEDPQVSPPGSTVVVIYPGANPADMEELIIDQIEEVINELEDIKKITSSAQDGLAVIGVEFLTGTDPDDKYSDVVQKVNSIRNSLPRDIFSLDITKWSITDVNVLQLALYSDSTQYNILEKEAEQLKRRIERVAGVQKVKVWAYPEQEIRIAIDLQKMAQYRLSLNQVIQSVQSAGQNIPGGSIDAGSKKYNIQTSGSFNSVEDVGNTVIYSAQGKNVYLRDIADIRFDYEDESYRARFLDQKAIFITVSQKPGTNIFDVTDTVKDRTELFRQTLPSGIELGIVFDQSESVTNRIASFFSNLLQGLLLVGMVVLIAVGIRASVIVILVIPISILIGIGFIDLTGFGLQQMTITGMVIALGLLVDNAIVVTENITRFMRMGYSPVESAIKGTAQIAWAITSSTATTILAFIPMMMMSNVTGDFIRSMPVTVIYTLTASLLVSIILTPYLCSKYLVVSVKDEDRKFRSGLNKFIESKYRRWLDFSLRKPAVIISTAIIIFVMSLGLFPLVGVSFFPKAEKPQFLINIDTPEGTSLDRTSEIAHSIENILDEKPDIKNFATNIGHGNPRIYYNVIPKNTTSTHAQIFVSLKEFDIEKFTSLISELRAELSDYAGARIEVKEFEQGPPVQAPIAIRVLGDNLEILKQIARDVEQMIIETKGTINVVNPLATSKTDLFININKEKAAMFGVPLIEIDRTVRASIAGLTVSSFRDSQGKEYNIVVRLPFKEKLQLEDLQKVYVTSYSGAQIPLQQLAKMEFQASPIKINHYNLERNVTITSDVIGNTSVDATTQQVISKLEAYAWPKGYRYSVGGEAESREESFGGMAQAILVAIIGIFGVLVLQFRSHRQPLIVFSAIPLAIIGSIIALLLTGYSFSFTAFVGITSLIGIVINNSIILVDYTNQLRAEGKDIISALKEAGETRFMPIILTTATTVGGLLPLTLRGGTLWAPMGWTIIGGLIASTMLTLIVVPVLYKIYMGKTS
jgi:multidrug efflux pump subunit AcrB